jgi:hypothetical protein
VFAVAVGVGAAQATAGAILTITPTSIDFGPVAPGGNATAQITLSSVGTAAVTVATPSFSASSDPAFSSTASAITLQPGASTSIQVDFNPTASTPALASGSLVFSSNDSANPTQSVALTGSVLQQSPPQGQLAVTPTSLTFNTTPSSVIAPQALSVSNTGTGSLSWTATSDDPTITLSVSSGSLTAGATTSVNVLVAPQSVVGTRTQHITVDAGAAGQAVVPVTIDTTLAALTDQFLPPLVQSTDPANAQINTGKNGRVVPVKVRIVQGGTSITDLNTPGPVTIAVSKFACNNNAGTDPVSTYADAGQSSAGTNQFNYDAAAQAWVYNLDTRALGLVTGNCYRIDVAVDGTQITNAFAVFQPTK